MSKIEIKIQGKTNECIDELALVLLQHKGIRDVVINAALKTLAVEALGHQAEIDQVTDKMKEFIKGN